MAFPPCLIATAVSVDSKSVSNSKMSPYDSFLSGKMSFLGQSPPGSISFDDTVFSGGGESTLEAPRTGAITSVDPDDSEIWREEEHSGDRVSMHHYRLLEVARLAARNWGYAARNLTDAFGSEVMKGGVLPPLAGIKWHFV